MGEREKERVVRVKIDKFELYRNCELKTVNLDSNCNGSRILGLLRNNFKRFDWMNCTKKKN